MCKKIFGVCWGGATKHCFDVPKTCPKHTADEEAELRDYRREQRKRAEAIEDLENIIDDDVPPIVRESATETVDKILFQVDVAGTLYIVYTCIALFFPSPLTIFRSPYSIAVKRFVFGAQKVWFIAFVLVIWWGDEYFQVL